MAKFAAYWGIAFVAFAAVVSGFDLPFDIGFQVGYGTYAVPSEADMSEELGLVVTTDRILTDKETTIVISGTIHNAGDYVCDNITLLFGITSYIGTMIDYGHAYLSASSLSPGEVATFKARILLGSEKPHLALYTVSASPSLP